MGIFNSFGAMSGQFAAKQERRQVAEALIEELKQPGKIAELLHTLNQNGLGTLLQQWVAGEKAPVTVAQLQQGLKQSTLLDALTTRTKMPIGVVKTSLSVLLPISIDLLAREGIVTVDGEPSGKVLDDSTDLAEALR